MLLDRCKSDGREREGFVRIVTPSVLPRLSNWYLERDLVTIAYTVTVIYMYPYAILSPAREIGLSSSTMRLILIHQLLTSASERSHTLFPVCNTLTLRQHTKSIAYLIAR